MERPNILIAVPCYRGWVHSICDATLFEMGKLLSAKGVRSSLGHVNAADIVKVRNLYATMFYETKAFTHMLFFDNDMGCDPKLAVRMLDADKPIIACVCPRRSDPPEFNVQFEPGKTVVAAKGVAEADRVGTAIMLIRRDAIEAMIATGKLRTQTKHPLRELSGPLYGFFDQIDGMTEDYSFCRRWRDLCGGLVHVIVDADISHAGDHVFTNNFAIYAQSKVKPSSP